MKRYSPASLIMINLISAILVGNLIPKHTPNRPVCGPSKSTMLGLCMELPHSVSLFTIFRDFTFLIGMLMVPTISLVNPSFTLILEELNLSTESHRL